jgi:hypothetical protein
LAKKPFYRGDRQKRRQTEEETDRKGGRQKRRQTEKETDRRGDRQKRRQTEMRNISPLKSRWGC